VEWANAFTARIHLHAADKLRIPMIADTCSD